MAQAGDLLFIIRMMRIESCCSQSSFTMFPHSCDAPLEHDGSTKLEVVAFSELIPRQLPDVDDAVSVECQEGKSSARPGRTSEAACGALRLCPTATCGDVQPPGRTRAEHC